MLERHFDAQRINEIVNDPSILPWIKGKYESLDLTKVTANPNCVCLVGEHGCVIFIKHQQGIYEYHTSVLPSGRGKWMMDGAAYAFAYMFTKTDAFELMTKCPDGNLASKAGARVVGCEKQFRTRPIWPVDGKLVPVDIWSILLPDWAQTVEGMAQKGHEFHEALHEKTGEINHEDDETHNRYVGITIEMIRAKQVSKAVCFYNRWAVMSAYEPIRILSSDPLIIDISSQKLKISNNDFEVM